MQQMIKAGRHSNPTRMAMACDDELEARIKSEAQDRHGLYASQYIRIVLQDHLASKESKRDLRLPAQAAHILEDAKAAASDGKISPIEREHLTDHLVDVLAEVRKSA